MPPFAHLGSEVSCSLRISENGWTIQRSRRLIRIIWRGFWSLELFVIMDSEWFGVDSLEVIKTRGRTISLQQASRFPSWYSRKRSQKLMNSCRYFYLLCRWFLRVEGGTVTSWPSWKSDFILELMIYLRKLLFETLYLFLKILEKVKK